MTTRMCRAAFLKKSGNRLLSACGEPGSAARPPDKAQKFFGSFFQKRTNLLWALAAVLAAGSAHAQSAPIEALNAGLAQADKDGSKPFLDRYNALAPVVDQAFDLQQILQTIVGLRWSQIPADQQTQLLAVFRAFTISSYAANFNSNSGDGFKLLPEQRPVGADVVVETQIVPKNGDPTRIDYVMRHEPAGWRAVDVLEDGTISQAAVQRSDFRGPLNEGGAPKLIESLKQKVATLSGNTVKP